MNYIYMQCNFLGFTNEVTNVKLWSTTKRGERGGGGPTHVSWTLKSKNNASR